MLIVVINKDFVSRVEQFFMNVQLLRAVIQTLA